MDLPKPVSDQTPRCNRCVHYYITHDPHFRYGCRALGFKSPRQPMLDVIEASGLPCMHFSAKKQSGSE